MKESLKTYRETVDARAAEVVKAMIDEKPEKVLKPLKKAVNAAVEAYNTKVAEEYYKDLAEKHGKDAVRMAITGEGLGGPFVPDVIKLQFKETDAGLVLVNETHPNIKISLPTMQTILGLEYFHDKDWFKRLNLLARLIAVTLNKKLHGSPAYAYTIDEAAKTFELDTFADPTNDESMAKAFQNVVDGVLWIGEETDESGKAVNGIKFEAEDWQYIRDSMTSNGGVCVINVASPATVSGYLADAIWRIINNGGYVLKGGSN